MIEYDTLLHGQFYQTYGNPYFKTPFGEKRVINLDVIASGYPIQSVDNYWDVWFTGVYIINYLML